jgi:hypothetical protein
LTRFQRASEGSSKSTRCGGDDVIQGSGVRLQNRRRHLVMFRYGAMHPEYYRPLFGRKIRPSDGALHALNAHIGPVNHLRHNNRMVSRKSAGAETGRRRPANLFLHQVSDRMNVHSRAARVSKRSPNRSESCGRELVTVDQCPAMCVDVSVCGRKRPPWGRIVRLRPQAVVELQ